MPAAVFSAMILSTRTALLRCLASNPCSFRSMRSIVIINLTAPTSNIAQCFIFLNLPHINLIIYIYTRYTFIIKLKKINQLSYAIASQCLTPCLTIQPLPRLAALRAGFISLHHNQRGICPILAAAHELIEELVQLLAILPQVPTLLHDFPGARLALVEIT